jgi:imidazolonepropionase-like amidohydrolase
MIPATLLLLLVPVGSEAMDLPGGERDPLPPLALVGATLVDGTGSPPVPDAVVVVEEGRIRCAGPREACPIPTGARVRDLRGRWIVPGLVDAHVHYSQTGWADGRPDALDLRAEHPYDVTVARLRREPETFFRSHLCAGVTSTFDVGGFPWSWELRDRAAGNPAAPRVRSAGPLLSTRDHWLNLPGERQFLHMSDRDATRLGVSYLVSAGTDAVKVWYLAVQDPAEAARQREHLEIAGRWARQHRIPLIVHATTLDGAKEALRAGATLLVHSVEDREVDREFLDLALRNGAVYTPTLTVYLGYDELAFRRFDESRPDLPCVDPGTLDRVRSTRAIRGAVEGSEREAREARSRERADRMAANVRAVHAAGVPVAAGTDAGNPLTFHGASMVGEVEALEAAGLTPLEALVAATRNGALAMGLQDEVGTVEVGKVADLLVLTADPLAGARNLGAVEEVFRAGVPFRRGELEWRHAGAP